MKYILLIFSLFAFCSLKAQMQTDYSDANWAIVIPVAQTKDVVMKDCYVGKNRDSVVIDFLYNKGNVKFRVDSIYFEGTDRNYFSLMSGKPPFEILPDGKVSVEFRFSPNSAKIHNAVIVVIIQGDTLRNSISGRGIQAQIVVVNDIIDFGKVYLGKDKDTIKAATIKNVGTAPIVITKTKHNLPNDKDFKTKNGGGSFTLKPDSIAIMDLNFKPSEIGITNGTLEFYYDGLGSPAIVQLYGEGINIGPKIKGELTPFSNLICENETVSEVKIKNIGGQDLTIDELSIIGDNASDYVVQTTTPVTVLPDDSALVYIKFIPKDKGNRTADLIIKSNSEIDNELHIGLSAYKDSVIVVPESYTIDFGYLCTDDNRDTTIVIKNIGTLPTYCLAEYSDNLHSLINNFVVNQNDNFSLSFGLKTNSDNGLINEKIRITDTICNRSFDIAVKGEVSVPVVQVENLNVTSLIGSSNEGELQITNNSKYNIIVNSPQNLTSQFEVVSPSFPILLQKSGGSQKVRIKYKPDNTVNDTCSAIFGIEQCNFTKVAELIGYPTISSAKFEIKSISAYSGEEISIPISLVDQQNLEMTGISGINAKFYFNPTLLAPLDYQSIKIDDFTAYIELSNLPLVINKNGLLADLKFKTGLGNAVNSILKLGDITCINGTSNIKVTDAEFTLLGICNEGGARLINPNSGEVLKSIIPNPAVNSINVKYQLSENGFTELLLQNSIGAVTKRFVLSKKENYPVQSMDIDLSDLNSGVYYLIVKTPATIESKSIIIIK